ncbi:unnamed protein product [Paramecium pentaurelia]|uniref:Uncharacterized protein n=1 Tax=Paramecium pentaurelia TaxID=43138 RepID=A0A8S1Y491_9CILI|nr:unnamed protein product [Paramecium pentaurelia]
MTLLKMYKSSNRYDIIFNQYNKQFFLRYKILKRVKYIIIQGKFKEQSNLYLNIPTQLEISQQNIEQDIYQLHHVAQRQSVVLEKHLSEFESSG